MKRTKIHIGFPSLLGRMLHWKPGASRTATFALQGFNFWCAYENVKDYNDKGGNKQWNTTAKKNKNITTKVRKQGSMTQLQTRKDMKRKVTIGRPNGHKKTHDMIVQSKPLFSLYSKKNLENKKRRQALNNPFQEKYGPKKWKHENRKTQFPVSMIKNKAKVDKRAGGGIF